MRLRGSLTGLLGALLLGRFEVDCVLSTSEQLRQRDGVFDGYIRIEVDVVKAYVLLRQHRDS